MVTVATLTKVFGVAKPVGTLILTTTPVKSNKIVNSSTYGIQLFTSGVTVQSNTITKSASAIRFSCNSGTVISNTINDAALGLDNSYQTTGRRD